MTVVEGGDDGVDEVMVVHVVVESDGKGDSVQSLL